jgi:hypothetical protein
MDIKWRILQSCFTGDGGKPMKEWQDREVILSLYKLFAGNYTDVSDWNSAVEYTDSTL